MKPTDDDAVGMSVIMIPASHNAKLRANTAAEMTPPPSSRTFTKLSADGSTPTMITCHNPSYSNIQYHTSGSFPA